MTRVLSLMSVIDESWDLAAKETKLIATFDAIPSEIGYAAGVWNLEYIRWPLERRWRVLSLVSLHR